MNTAQQLNELAQRIDLTTEEIIKQMRKLTKQLTKEELLMIANCTHTARNDGTTLVLDTVEETPIRLATENATKNFNTSATKTAASILAELPSFTRGSILTSMAMSLNYRMMGQAIKMIRRDQRAEQREQNEEDSAPTRIAQFIDRESQNASPADLPQSPEQMLYELQNVRAAFADAAFDANPNARIGFDQMLQDAKEPRVNASDIKLFMELDNELPREIVEKMFLQYAEQRCNEITEHEAALVDILRCYDTVGTDLDESLAGLPATTREDLLNKLVVVTERRQQIVDPMASNEPEWVKRMNPLARYKESKLLKGAITDLNTLISTTKPKRRAI